MPSRDLTPQEKAVNEASKTVYELITKENKPPQEAITQVEAFRDANEKNKKNN